jgi:hypothetical protein
MKLKKFKLQAGVPGQGRERDEVGTGERVSFLNFYLSTYLQHDLRQSTRRELALKCPALLEGLGGAA